MYMISPKEKTRQLYDKFYSILYLSMDRDSLISLCMDVYIEENINDNYFSRDAKKIDYWKQVKVEKRMLFKKNNSKVLLRNFFAS